MDFAAIISFTLFAFIAAFTPGPNNVMLAASGANYGIRQTLPHMWGVTIGFLALVLAGGLGLTSLFLTFPEIYNVMRIAALGFLFYVAWKIAKAGPVSEASSAKPMSFTAAFLFQWVNPKGTSVVLSAITAYIGAGDTLFRDLAIIIVIFGIATFLSTLAWAGLGKAIGRFLQNDQLRKRFNYSMAAILVVALIPVIFST